MTLKQFKISKSSIGSEIDSLQQRTKYESQKERLYDLLKSSLNLEGTSWLDDGTLEVVADNTILEIENFLKSQNIKIQTTSKIILYDTNNNDKVSEKLEADPLKQEGSLRVKQ